MRKPRSNVRSRFEDPKYDYEMVAENPTGSPSAKERRKMNQTIHKAVAAFFSSFVTMLVAMGVVLPAWVTEQGISNVSWIIALIISGAGAFIPAFTTWAVRNHPRTHTEGPLGGGH